MKPPALSAHSKAEMSSNLGTKDDFDKVKLSLIPPESVIEIARVFTYGAAKYKAHNFRGGMAWSRMIDALQRHITAWQRGEENDSESGLSHLAHAGCCLMMLMVYADDPKRYGTFDDRYKPTEPVGGPVNLVVRTALRSKSG